MHTASVVMIFEEQTNNPRLGYQSPPSTSIRISTRLHTGLSFFLTSPCFSLPSSLVPLRSSFLFSSFSPLSWFPPSHHRTIWRRSVGIYFASLSGPQYSVLWSPAGLEGSIEKYRRKVNALTVYIYTSFVFRLRHLAYYVYIPSYRTLMFFVACFLLTILFLFASHAVPPLFVSSNSDGPSV